MGSLAAAAHGTAFLVFRVHHYTHGPSQFQHAASASDEKIALIGVIKTLFEDLMYTFVFLSTPALFKEIDHSSWVHLCHLHASLNAGQLSGVMSSDTVRF